MPRLLELKWSRPLWWSAFYSNKTVSNASNIESERERNETNTNRSFNGACLCTDLLSKGCLWKHDIDDIARKEQRIQKRIKDMDSSMLVTVIRSWWVNSISAISGCIRKWLICRMSNKGVNCSTNGTKWLTDMNCQKCSSDNDCCWNFL